MKSYEIEPGVNAQTILRTGDQEDAALGKAPLGEFDPDREGDPTLQRRRPLYLIAIVLAILSLPFGQPLLFLAGLLLFALTLVPEIWYRWGLRALALNRRLSTNRAEFGDTVEITLTIENRKPLPLPWLEIDDDFSETFSALGASVHPTSSDQRVLLRQTVAVWAYQRLRRRFRVQATSRGIYPVGPMTVRITDPFGILEREARLRNFDYLVVHPLVAPLERFGLPPNAPFGERKSPRRLLEDPLRIAGVREYAQGDEPRRIHWKATARTGALQSKVYEPATRHALIILLDVRTFSNPLIGYDPNLMELAVTAAASVATWAAEQRYAIGIHSNGTQALADVVDIAQARQSSSFVDFRRDAQATPNQRLRVPLSNGAGQLTRVLDGLARVLPYYGLPMEELIAAELPQVPFGATVVYIGAQATLDVPLIIALRQLKLRGHAVTLLLTTSSADKPEQEFTPRLAGLPTHTIGDRRLWDDLVTDVLGPPALRQNASVRSLRVPRPPNRNHGSTSATQPSNDALPNGITDARADRADGASTGATSRGPRALVVE